MSECLFAVYNIIVALGVGSPVSCSLKLLETFAVSRNQVTELANCGDTSMIEFLRSLLDPPDGAADVAIESGLGKLGDEDVFRRARARTKSKSISDRRHGFAVLEGVGTHRAVRELGSLLHRTGPEGGPLTGLYEGALSSDLAALPVLSSMFPDLRQATLQVKAEDMMSVAQGWWQANAGRFAVDDDVPSGQGSVDPRVYKAVARLQQDPLAILELGRIGDLAVIPYLRERFERMKAAGVAQDVRLTLAVLALLGDEGAIAEARAWLDAEDCSRRRDGVETIKYMNNATAGSMVRGALGRRSAHGAITCRANCDLCPQVENDLASAAGQLPMQ